MKIKIFLICLASVSWGTTGAAMILMSQEASLSPLIVSFWRMAISAPLLILIGSRIALDYSALRKHLCKLIGLGSCMALYQICYFSAVNKAGIAVTALVAICSSPLFIAFIAAWSLKEKITIRILSALVLGILGTGLLVFNPHVLLETSQDFFIGTGIALGAGLLWASYAVLAKATISRLHPLQVSACSFSLSAIFLLPALLFQPFDYNSFTQGLPYLLYLGIIPTSIAYGIYFWGLQGVSATVAGILALLEPLTATLIGVVYFKEPFSLLSGVGAVLMLLALLILTLPIKQLKYKTAYQRTKK